MKLVTKDMTTKITSLLLVFLYCFSISSAYLSHNHNDACNHNSKETLFCDTFFESINENIICSHESHLANLVETCDLSSYFISQDKIVTNHSPNYRALFFPLEILSKFEIPYIHNKTSCLNKSPPFIV